MQFMFTSPPLRKLRITQPFGVNYGPTKDFYTKVGIPSGLHNGWDCSAPNGTEILAVADGTVEAEGDPNSGYGLHARLFVYPNPDYRFECVYGHLKEVRAEGKVIAGQVIALSNNTGYSTGPHLHFGVRAWARTQGGIWRVVDQDNGYHGYIDPQPLFAPDVDALPVDKKYGLKESDRGYSDWEWYKVAAWIYGQKKRLPTLREKIALIWGRWDFRTVNDPAMYGIWTEMSKPEAEKRGIVK